MDKNRRTTRTAARQPGPPRDPRLRRALEDYLWKHRNRQVAASELGEVAAEVSGHPVSRQSVYNWLQFWTLSGFLQPDGTPTSEPPEQLYLLLLEVPRSQRIRRKVQTRLRRHAAEQPESVTGLFNVLVRVRAHTAELVERLADECIAAGARDARTFLHAIPPAPRVATQLRP